ncbi:hypothetical protein FALB51S_03352 [Frigidibacter albus]
MAQPEMKPGDLVKLKSGGPVMVLAMAPGCYGSTLRCYWFTGTTPQDASFPLETLEPAQHGGWAASV